MQLLAIATQAIAAIAITVMGSIPGRRSLLVLGAAQFVMLARRATALIESRDSVLVTVADNAMLPLAVSALTVAWALLFAFKR